MDTRFATSPDETRIAYDVIGTGPALMLLHGGGSCRQDWYENGYVDQLHRAFTVMPVDMRGHGESDKPVDPACYKTERMVQDLLAVADDFVVKKFMVLGYSLGGNVGKYLAADSDRLSRLVMIGNRLGVGVSGDFRQLALDLQSRWGPVVKQARAGEFDPHSLSPEGQADIAKLSFPGELLPVLLGLTGAILDWGIISPPDLRCPTLWLIGSENTGALQSWEECKQLITGSRVLVHIVDGLDHGQEFSAIDQVLPVVMQFLQV